MEKYLKLKKLFLKYKLIAAMTIVTIISLIMILKQAMPAPGAVLEDVQIEVDENHDHIFNSEILSVAIDENGFNKDKVQTLFVTQIRESNMYPIGTQIAAKFNYYQNDLGYNYGLDVDYTVDGEEFNASFVIKSYL